jgi:hypothetical protein
VHNDVDATRILRLLGRLGSLVAGLRVLLGVVALVAPELPARPWVGEEDACRPSAHVLARALGSRDVALGLAVLQAPSLRARRLATLLGAAADLGDLVTTRIEYERLPRVGRALVLASTAGAVAAGVVGAAFDQEHGVGAPTRA